MKVFRDDIKKLICIQGDKQLDNTVPEFYMFEHQAWDILVQLEEVLTRGRVIKGRGGSQ